MSKICAASTLAFTLACDSAVADGYVFLDGSTLGDDVVAQLDARAPGHLYIGTKVRIGTPGAVLILDVAASQPTDPAPRLTGYAYPQGIIDGPRVAPSGSFFALGLDYRVVGRDAAGTLLYTSTPVADGRLLSANTMAPQADGKILVGGSRNTAGGVGVFPEEWSLDRLNLDGTLDASFQGGRVNRDPSPNDEYVAQLAVAPNGKIVASGPRSETLIGRFFADGLSDFNFGATGGLVPLAEGSGDLQVDSSQRVYVRAGNRLVTRLLEDGTLDSSYAGVLQGANVTVTGMMLDSQNRIVLFGHRVLAGWIARLTTTGDPDPTFGAAGTGEIDVPFPRTLANEGRVCVGSLQPDDKPVIACTVQGISDSFMFVMDVGVARFNTDGTLDVGFGNSPDADTYPHSFSFVPATVAYGTAAYVVSNPVTITGINVSAVPVGGSEYSVGCTNVFTPAPGTIASGERVCVRARASSQPGGVVEANLTVGGRNATFTVTASNSPADPIPDNFAFADQTGVAVNTVMESARINVTGLTGFATSTVTGGSQSFNCEPTGFTTDPIIVSEGGTICVRHTSSRQFSSGVDTVLTINGVTDTFTSTTQAAPPAQSPPSSIGGAGGGGALDAVLAVVLACLAASASRGRRRRRLHFLAEA